MKKKLSNSDNPDPNEIELPLLSKHQPTNLKPKTHFLNFLDSNSSSAKYIKDMSFFKFVTFADVWPLVKRVNAKSGPITIDDMPLPFSFCNVEPKIIELDAQWSKAQHSGKQPSVIRSTLSAYKKECFIMTLLGFLLINGKLISSLLMGSIIGNVTKSNLGNSVELKDMLIAAASFSAITFLLGFINVWYWHLSVAIGACMRGTIIGFVYKKLQSVALSSLQEINVGKVINLLSNDINELDRGFIYLVPLILCPYTIGLGAYLVWEFFGFATIFGILGLIVFLIFSNYLSKKAEVIRTQKNVITDERIKLTSELIECIRLIKMYAWEKAFKQAIKTLREREVVKLMRLKLLEALGESVANTSCQSSLAVMCVVYTLNGGILSPQKIYTSFVILNFVSIWATTLFHYGIMFVASCRVMKKRIEDILLIKDVATLEEVIKRSSSFNEVNFKDFNAWWKKDDPKPCLSNINITLRPGQLTTAIGSIGSGKTSFLLSFLKETPVTQGQLVFKGSVAYVEQEPLIFSGTVRFNILFGLQYDEALYKKVVRACNLQDDFRQFDNGDITVIGERGITLSGGQKARISLARALYSQSDIYLLDDPLSAVDSKVGRHLFRYAIKGDLLKDKVVVLVTHHLNYAKESDRVLLFSEGRIIADGAFEEIRNRESGLFDRFKEVEDEAEKGKSSHKESKNSKDILNSEEKILDKQVEAVTGESNSVTVSWKTYINYAKQNGNYLFITIVLIGFVLYSSTVIGFSRYIGYWGQAHTDFYANHTGDGSQFDNTPYITVIVSLAVGLIFGQTIRMLLTNHLLVKANTNMHHRAIRSIIKGRTLFFDQTPIGAILNRFSNDLGTLDGGNAALLPAVFDGFLFLILRMTTLIAINPYLIIPLLAVLALLYKSKRVFQKTIMETKRIDLASKSPLYSEISATINGLLAIRVFRQGGTFVQRFCGLLYNNIRAYFYMDRILRFFGLTMSMALDSLAIAGTFACIFVSYYLNLEAGLFGLALFVLEEIASYGSKVVRLTLLVDINMQSVERILRFYTIDSEAPKKIPNTDNTLAQKPSKGEWPYKGEVTLNNIYMKYRPEFDYVLRGLTFRIVGGHKIGIVGRTGAGKSSIIQALFRMTEIENIPGSCIEIDGTDISKIGLHLLRNSVSIIPQTPVVFTGKIRRNLDPFDKFTDNDLWRVLEEVNLKDHVRALEKQLDTDMTMSSSVFSAGQKQLICLARAILRKSKIIILDEATANVDIETDNFIQNKIMEKFKDSTVITIAHRLITIANYDKVLVMDKGKAIEYDSPYRLMVTDEGDKGITRNASAFAQMVCASGESVARKIFETAYNKFYQGRLGNV